MKRFIYLAFFFIVILTTVLSGCGGSSSGSTDSGPVSTTITSIATCCGSHSLALNVNGMVWAWGKNNYGQLGDGTYNDSNIPVLIKNLINIKAIACGVTHSLAVTNGGMVWAWGSNGYGQLGNGLTSTTGISTPFQINGLTNVVMVAAGDNFSLALKKDGTVWAWGSNSAGRLGINDMNNTTIKCTPTKIPNFDNVTAIFCGVDHSFAIKEGGTVYAWGYNNYGKLGDGTSNDQYAPEEIVSLSNNVSTIACGFEHTLAVKKDGTVLAWGYNIYGQLGNDSTTTSPTPVSVKDLTDVVSVAAGDWHSLALKKDGTVWAWGWNTSGQLGDGTNNLSHIPVQTKNLTDVASIACGDRLSLALKSNGEVITWGNDVLIPEPVFK